MIARYVRRRTDFAAKRAYSENVRQSAGVPQGAAQAGSFNPQEHTMTLSFKRLSTVAAVAALTVLMGCAATSKSEGTGAYIDDSVITTKTKAAIFNDADLKASEINVETYKGRVQLSGFVKSQADINRAVTLTQGIAGVTSVKNDMRLK
jgi:osmotically-inducible protein OsmY